MNYTVQPSTQMDDFPISQLQAEHLAAELTHLLEWKQKAMVQLAHFRSACLLYKFYEVDKLNELLNA